MKRQGGLMSEIATGDNLRLAFWKASRGKRATGAQRLFAERLDENLGALREELVGARPLRVGEYSQFVIYDPKERVITAPSFRERVLHHALINCCGPVFERTAIADSYACRPGKGRLAAIARAREFAGRFPFFAKFDVRKYFDSIPHEALIAGLQRLFREERLLTIWRLVVGGFAPPNSVPPGGAPIRPRRGLPIGSLTSQYLANFYLGSLDRFVKENLRIRGYVRYMDDFVLWDGFAGRLDEAIPWIETWLDGQLGLQLKARVTVGWTQRGMDFLGYRIFRHRVGLNARSRRRFAARLRRYERQYDKGDWSELELQRRVTALVAFTRHADCGGFRRRVIERLDPFGGFADRLEPRQTGW